VLVVSNLEVSYGAIRALQGVSLTVPDGAVVALVGANGAGKSTTLNTISGLLRPRSGSILFDGVEIAGWRPERIVARGIVQVPEGRQVLGPLTVEENLQLGAITRGDRKNIVADIERMYEHFPVLKERHTQQAGTLSGGEQQMLAVARALMLRPRLMLLDEPSFGLAPLIVRDLFKILGKINREDKVTILVVEQNAQLALELADQAYVIETGKIVMSGNAKEIASNEDVRKSYLGY